MQNSDMLGALKGLLGDNADEKIGSIMSALRDTKGKAEETINKVDNDINFNSEEKKGIELASKNTDNNFNTNGFLSPDGIEFMSRIKNMVDEMGTANDSRSNLLMSLRPYMRESRRRSIDNAVKLLNLSRMSGIFKIWGKKMYRSYSINDMPQMVKRETPKNKEQVSPVSNLHNKTIEEATGIIKDGKFLGKFELDDIILIAIIVMLLTNDCDDKLLLLAIGFVFISGII